MHEWQRRASDLEARSQTEIRARSPSLPVSQWTVERLSDKVRSCIVPSKTVQNWGGSFACLPRRIFAPGNVEQCCAVIELARRIGGVECRPIGRSHSPGDVQFTQDWLIQMHNLHGLLSIRTSPQPSITVLAGTFVSSMHTMLENAEEPLAMPNLGSISEQTIGGLIATASHGTGIRYPVLSVAVESLRIVCARSQSDGGTQVVECSRTSNAELFNATLCGLGATGLIVEVTLNVDHWFKLKQISEECHFDELFGPPTDYPAIEVNTCSLDADDLFRKRHSTASLLEYEASQNEICSQRLGNVLARRATLVPACAESRLPTFRTERASDIHPIVKNTTENVEQDPGWETIDEVTSNAQRNLESLAASAQHVRIAWFPHAEMCTVMRINRTLDPIQTPTLLTRWWNDLIGYHLLQPMLLFARVFPSTLPVINRSAYQLTHPRRTSPLRSIVEKPLEHNGRPVHERIRPAIGAGEQEGRIPMDAIFDKSPSFTLLNNHNPHTVLVDAAPKIFNVNCLFRQYTDEWAIPLANAASALRAMRDWLKEEERSKNGEPVHFPVEVRFVDADGIWLSPSHGRKTCYIGIVQYRPFNFPVRYRSLFAKFETLMRFYGGRPHWAKAHSCGPNELGRLYPDLPKFLALRQAADPDGVFLSPYVRRHLMGDVSSSASARMFKSRL